MKRRLATKTISRSLALSAILALLGVGVILPACAAENQAQGNPPADMESMSGSDPVAKVGDMTITYADLEEAAAPQLKQLEAQRQKVLESTLSQVVEQKLVEVEAAARNMTPDELMAAEVESTVGAVTDAEIDSWYEQNKERVRQPKEQVIDQIRQFLTQQRMGEAQGTFMASLKEKHAVRILLEPPRQRVEVAGAPTKGPADAPVTIVEFSDFECPFCSRVNPALAQVRENYGDKVRIAFRQFPLSIHPNAQKAAEASLCAHDQGKFWELHDAMFADQRNLGVDALKAKASSLGLNAEAFNQCLDSGKYAQRVADDMQAGQAAGVTGTPAMFVNGRLVSGAVPYEQIKQVIDDELSRKSGE